MQWVLAVVLLVLAGGLWLGVNPRQLPRQLGWGPREERSLHDQQATVLLVVVQDVNQLERLRKMVPAQSVVFQRPDAFAVRSGRIFATGVEAASRPLSELGWAERRLEIVDRSQLARPGAAAPAGTSAFGAPGGGGVQGEESLATLAKKETLTAGEALRLLQQMQ